MQEREARLLSESGDLEQVIISPTSDNAGWTLTLVAKNGDQHLLNSKRSREPRVFKTSDASLRCCLRIHINEAVVKLV